MTGEQQPRDRDRGIGDTADGIHEIVIGKARFAAQEHRMQEHCGLQLGRRFPERVELRVVEHTSQSLGQRTDHDSAKTGLKRLGQHFGRHVSVLQGHGGERRETRLAGESFAHAVVDETAPGQALLRRQLIAEAVEPAADQLMVDAVFVHPATALAKVR